MLTLQEGVEEARTPLEGGEAGEPGGEGWQGEHGSPGTARSAQGQTYVTGQRCQWREGERLGGVKGPGEGRGGEESQGC